MCPDDVSAPASPLTHELQVCELISDLLSKRTVVRVTYRRRHTRRWYHVTIVPEEGETVESLAAKVWPSVSWHEVNRR